MNDKTGYVPPEDRKSDHAPLGPSDIEYLEMLVLKGEGLMLSSLRFGQAEALLRSGHAQIVDTYEVGEQIITRIEPTELGRTLAAAREATKLARLEAPTLLPPPSEKS